MAKKAQMKSKAKAQPAKKRMMRKKGESQGKNSTRPESPRKFTKLEKKTLFLVETWQKRGRN